MNVISLQRLIH